MTVDIEVIGDSSESDPSADSPRRSPDEDDAELVTLARSRMLNFHLLQSLPRDSLSVRPVGPGVADPQMRQGRTASLVVPLERDESTRAERVQARDAALYARRPPSSRFDMLTGQVPGTDVVVGISRRLFAACSSLAAEQAQLLSVFRADLPDMAGTIAKESMDEEEVEAFLRERRAAFAEREAGVEDQLRGATRRAYEFGRESSWQQLIDI